MSNARGGGPVRCADGRAGLGVAAAARVAGTAARLGAAPRVEGSAGLAAGPARLGVLGAGPVGRPAPRPRARGRTPRPAAARLLLSVSRLGALSIITLYFDLVLF